MCAEIATDRHIKVNAQGIKKKKDMEITCKEQRNEGALRVGCEITALKIT